MAAGSGQPAALDLPDAQWCATRVVHHLFWQRRLQKSWDSVAEHQAGLAAATQLTRLELGCGGDATVKLLVNGLMGLREAHLGVSKG